MEEEGQVEVVEEHKDEGQEQEQVGEQFDYVQGTRFEPKVGCFNSTSRMMFRKKKRFQRKSRVDDKGRCEKEISRKSCRVEFYSTCGLED